MNQLPRSSRWALGIAVVFYTVGLIGHLVPVLLPWMLLLTPWFLLGSGLAMAVVYGWGADWKALVVWLLPVLFVTFGLEVLGVATGAVFGPYHYTTVLGTLYWDVPPVIGWNWVLVVLGAYIAVRHFFPRVPSLIRILFVGIVCVAFYLLLEPVAIGLGYWVWHTPWVPLQNYLAWGLIAAAGAWWAERFPSLPSNPLLSWYTLLQAIFFLILALWGPR
jgi:putative membrane protein